MADLAARHLYEDAKRYAEEAEKLGETSWRTNTVIALAAYYGGDLETAYDRAAVAVKQIPPGDTSWNSMAVVTVFGEGRWKAIKAAVKEGKEWPPEWLTDLHAAYSILLHHPLGTDQQVLWHYDLLDWLGVNHRATNVLREGIDRFLDSPALHAKLRERVLRFRGADGLEATYEEMLSTKNAPGKLEPYAGIASVAAAEYHRRHREWEKARAAYGRAIAHFENGAKAAPAGRPYADRSVAMALAGRARVSLEIDDLDPAVDDIIASFERDATAPGTRDGMNITPGETALALLARLKETDKTEETARLETAMGKMDPELMRSEVGLEEQR